MFKEYMKFYGNNFCMRGYLILFLIFPQYEVKCLHLPADCRIVNVFLLTDCRMVYKILLEGC